MNNDRLAMNRRLMFVTRQATAGDIDLAVEDERGAYRRRSSWIWPRGETS